MAERLQESELTVRESAAERRGIDLSAAPEHVQAPLNRIMYLEDEVERLRAALQEIADDPDGFYGSAASIAREALDA